MSGLWQTELTRAERKEKMLIALKRLSKSLRGDSALPKLSNDIKFAECMPLDTGFITFFWLNIQGHIFSRTQYVKSRPVCWMPSFCWLQLQEKESAASIYVWMKDNNVLKYFYKINILLWTYVRVRVTL